MTDLTEKTPALDEQSAVENSEEITQTPSVWKEIFYSGRMEKQLNPRAIIGAVSALSCFEYGNKCLRFRACDNVGFNVHQYGCFALS